MCAFKRKSTAFSHPLPLALLSHAPTFPLSHTHSSSYTHTLLSHTFSYAHFLTNTFCFTHTFSLTFFLSLTHTHILSYFLSHTHSLTFSHTHTQNTLSHTHVHCSSRYFTSSRTISFKNSYLLVPAFLRLGYKWL